MILNYNEFITESIDDTFELTFYHVRFDTNETSDIEYKGPDKEEALNIYNNYDINDVDKKYQNRTDLYVSIEQCTNKYKFVYELDDEYESIEDYPIENFYNTDYYKLVDDGEYEEIQHKTLEAINKKSDDLLEDVERYYQEKYGRYKYNTILVHDDENDLIGTIQLRLADHTENLNNNDRFDIRDYYISVVIADDDATKTRFQYNDLERRNNEYSLDFNSDSEFDDVVSEIDDLIEEISDKIKNAD